MKHDLCPNLVTSGSDQEKVAQYTVGEIVKVTILEVNDHGVLCETESEVHGFATLDHMPGILYTNISVFICQWNVI